MMRRTVPVVALLGLAAVAPAADAPVKPNIVFILADDLGYGDLGCYGQERIRTPRIDRMASEGMRFTQCYAGSTVCAPSRCALMTGLHTGHCTIRGNAAVPLRPEDRTAAELLKEAGYATGLIGKWGLGENATTGAPNKHGFDYFYGFLNQTHAHNYYPDYLWRNGEKAPIPANVQSAVKGVAEKRAEYAPDLFLKEGLEFIEKHKGGPFFLYFASTVPHANNERTKAQGNGMEVPDAGSYADRDWPTPEKDKAAMIARLDGDVGKLLAKLKDLKIDDKTIVFFTSDNGPHREGGNDPRFFNSSGGLRGIKRDLYEGGVREPMIVRWPGHVQAGAVSNLQWAFWDFLPTCAELVGAKPPDGIDGLSVIPTLLGKGDQKTHPYLYWEFHEGPTKQAVRFGDWKAVRLRPTGPVELYDLRADVGEQNNVAGHHPDLVARAKELFTEARTDSARWPLTDAVRRPARPNRANPPQP
ncbi:MAG TPA: arylsulfatase [Gemmataceae bacterium]|jgi:arylsulfatase A-like enzyme